MHEANIHTTVDLCMGRNRLLVVMETLLAPASFLSMKKDKISSGSREHASGKQQSTQPDHEQAVANNTLATTRPYLQLWQSLSCNDMPNQTHARCGDFSR